MAGVPEENLEWKGTQRNVAFAQWSGRDRTIADWEGLDYRARSKFKVHFNALCQNGTIPVPEQWRPLGAGIWEFKVNKPAAWRIGAFQDGRTWFLTHVFKKPRRKKRLRAEIDKAKRAREEHLLRRRNE